MNKIVFELNTRIDQLNLTALDNSLFKLAQKLTAHRLTHHGRAHSHGLFHLHQVSRLAIYIADATYIIEPAPNFYAYVLICAWCHDLLDHKYAADIETNKQEITLFLKQNTTCDPDLVFNIIERVSFSHEAKHGDADWPAVLGSYGTAIRNVVSDADKLDALGAAGVSRCRAYVQETHPDLSEAEINARVLEHADHKLLRLAAEFMRTEIGRQLAAPLHDEMIAELGKLNKQ